MLRHPAAVYRKERRLVGGEAARTRAAAAAITYGVGRIAGITLS